MEFSIDSEITGLPFDLDSMSRRTAKIELYLTRNSCEEINKLYLCNLPNFPSEKFLKTYNSLEISTKNIPWPLCMSKEVYQQEIKDFIKATREVLVNDCTDDFSYYLGWFKQGQKIYDAIRPVKINQGAFDQAVSENPTDMVLGSFKPNIKTGFAYLPEYSRVDTITGRLKIIKGPQILHLRKAHRNKIFESRFGTGGKVYEFDYKCLEPRVLLALKGTKNIPVDIYTYALKELFPEHPNLDRQRIKQILLTRLYGGSLGELETLSMPVSTSSQFDKSILSPRPLSVDVIDSVGEALEEFFGVKELRSRLVGENRSNCIKSHYGRVVSTLQARNSILVNYFTQSTAMTVAELGFSKIVNKLEDKGLLHSKVFPLFVLTDALYMDIDNSVEDRVVSMVKEEGSMNIPLFDGDVKFHLDANSL